MMEEKIVNIINAMAEVLNISQLKKLQEMLLTTFADSEPEKQEILNEEYLELFLEAKRIEGCSERTLTYYQSSVKRFLISLDRSIRFVSIEEMKKHKNGRLK